MKIRKFIWLVPITLSVFSVNSLHAGIYNDNVKFVNKSQKTYWNQLKESGIYNLSEAYSDQFLKRNKNETNIIYPNKLKKGDTIAILELSRIRKINVETFKNTRIPEIVKNLRQKGFKAKVYDESFTATNLDLGDETKQLRADIFNKAVKDPEIKAIFAFCGGSGTMQTLDKIDYDSFRQNNKIFVGFSDETAAELAILKKSGVITFHGPLLGSTLNYKKDKTFDNLIQILTNSQDKTEIYNIDDNSSFKSFNGKSGSGEICGGNLCLMQCLMGTQYCPDYENKILFFEETEGSAHGIHRILWQFKLAGILDKLSGVVIGTFSKSNQEAMLEACFDVLKEYDFPILYNVHAGHIENPLTIPIGAKATIQNNKLIIDQPFIK